MNIGKYTVLILSLTQFAHSGESAGVGVDRISPSKPDISAEKPDASEAPAVVREGQKISDIRFNGCQRIESETASSYISLRPGDVFDDDGVNDAIKELMDTGFFENISVERKGSVVVFNVKEYPVIDKISFEGNSKIADKDILRESKLLPREVLSPSKIKSIQQSLLASYRKMGRFNASVEPKIIKLDNNRVNVVFEINEGDTAHIRDIVFIGNKHFSSGELRDLISSKIERWYRFMVVDDIYDEDRLMEDQMILHRFYAEEGFADCRIVSAIGELAPNKKGFIITFTIDEGEIYKFRKVDVKSSVKGIEVSDLKKDLYCVSGEKYKASFIEVDIHKMTNKIGAKGFSAIRVEPILSKNQKTKTVDINYEISKGNIVYISKIVIKGNTRTRDHVIRREIPLEEGDAYNASLANLAESKLRSTGFFKSVDFEVIPDPNSPDRCIVQVEVQENSTGEVSVSGSYSTQDGLGLELSYSEKNFFGTGKTFGVMVGSGRARSGSSYRVDNKTKREYAISRKNKFKFLNSIIINASDPHLFDKDIEGSAGLFKYSNGKWDTFTSDEIGMTLGIGYDITSRFSQNWEYTLNRRKFADVYMGCSPIVRYQVMQKDKEGVPSKTRPDRSLLSSLKHTISFNDSFLKGLGGMVRLGLGTTIAGLGGNARHLKNELFGAYIMPVGYRSNIKFSATAGLLTKIGKHNPYIVDSFSLGLDSFRGFDDCGVGPRVETTYNTPFGPQTFSEYIGAKKYWKGTVEFTFPLGLPEELQFRGSVFSDFGTAWDAPEKGKSFIKQNGKWDSCSFAPGLIKSNILDKKKIRMSVGTSISLLTPFGPIKITYALPVRKEKYDVPYRILLGYTTTF